MPPLFKTIAELAELFGFSREGIRKRVGRLPSDAVERSKKPGQPMRVNFPAFLESWIEAEVLKRPKSRNGHPAASVEPSALEELRREQVAIRKLERLTKEGTLANVDDLRVGIDAFSAHIRRAGERMQKRAGMTGPEACEELRRALENARREFRSHLPNRNEHEEN
ncbi:MAG: hypothetical protein HQ582_31740 [Planctomycetes bacterium]|nr:hypothetical protein [Planctomycetota bacterium]